MPETFFTAVPFTQVIVFFEVGFVTFVGEAVADGVGVTVGVALGEGFG